MSNATARDDAAVRPSSPGMTTLAAVALFYLAAVAVATYPAITTIGSNLPSLGDPLTHLWTMRWYKACLLEGRSPFVCPDVQHPVGAPLGIFPPLQLQTLFYIPLSTLVNNDILCYNLIGLFGMLYTGLGTFALAWYVLRDRACAAFAGLLAMLSTPMMLHAHGHLELIHVGGVPLFLVAWMRFVDRPGRGRLLAASALYVLVAMSAHYYVVMAVFPAVLYLLGRMLRARREGVWTWCRERAGWLLGFGALTGLLLVALFAVPLWTIAQGQSMARPRSQFVMFHAPLWGYVVPTALHALNAIMPFNAYDHTLFHQFLVESGSYLGVVTLVLLQYAAVQKVKFPRAAFWWSALAAMVVLSLGAMCRIGDTKVNLPCYYLWEYFPPFRLLRVPARFNLFASVCAALIAAAGLKHLLARLGRPARQVAVYAALCAVAIADMAMVPFRTQPVPNMPACYAWIRERDPRASLLELPLLTSSSASPQNALCGYWQSIHRLRTTAGYSAHPNARYDTQVVHNSPFDAYSILKADYLQHPEAASFGISAGVDVRDYLWLHLTANRVDYLVLHREREFFPEQWQHLDRLEALLRDAIVHEDSAATVYARSRLKPPSRPTLVHADGWRSGGWPANLSYTLGKTGSVLVYNPDPGRELTFSLGASSFLRPRTVRLLSGDRELARWRVEPGEAKTHSSPPFRLPSGLQSLAIVSDGEERPTRRRDAATEGDMRPFSLRVAAIGLKAGPGLDELPARVASRPRAED